MTITITLNQIKKLRPNNRPWKRLKKSLGKKHPDDEPLTFSYIADTIDVEFSLWCLRILGGKYLKERCYLMAAIIESVAYIYNEKHPNDNSVNDCVQAIRDYSDGKITKKQLIVYRDAAAAAEAAYAAYASVDDDNDAYAASYAAAATYSATYFATYTAAAYTAAAYAGRAAGYYAYFKGCRAGGVGEERQKQIGFIKQYLG